MESPRVLGMGDALNALGTSTAALYENPANLPLARVYHFEGIATFSPEARRQSYGGAVVDSSTNKFAGGFAGTWNQLDPDGIHRTWTDLRLGLAYPLGDKFAVGVTGRYLRVDQAGYGPFGGGDLISGGTAGQPVFDTFTFDAGLAAVPVEGLHLGIVGHNLTDPGNGLAPTTLAGGAGYTTSIFSFEADMLGDFTTWGRARPRVMLGGELFLANRIPIRLGYRYDDGTRTDAFSAGVGYVDPHWAVELSARHDFIGQNPSTMMTLALRYFYDATGNASTPADTPDTF
jgi:hypothetical protein